MFIKYKASDYLNIFKHTSLGISLKLWIKILKRHRYNIGPPFIPKAIFITFTALINWPFQFFEKALYDRKIRETRVRGPIFILGHPRSGTTFLHYLLSGDPNLAFCTTADALTPHIMLTTGNFMEGILDKFMPNTRPQDNVKAGAKMPKEEEFAMANVSEHSFMHGITFPNDLPSVFKTSVTFEEDYETSSTKWKKDFHYLIQKLTLKNEGKRLVLKSPANTARLKELNELYPDAVFIHIHRNPYEVYQSTEKLYRSVIPLLSLHKYKTISMKSFIQDSYVWMLTKFLTDKHNTPSDRIYELGYAEFIKAPEKFLMEIYSKLGLGSFENIASSIRAELKEFDNYKVNKHVEIAPEEKEQINIKWGFFFDEYGYEMEEII